MILLPTRQKGRSHSKTRFKRFMQGSRLTKPGLPVKDTKSGEACSRVSSVLTAGERRVQSFMSRQTARVSMQSRCHRNGPKYGDLKTPVTMRITLRNAGNFMRLRHRWTSPRVLSRRAGCHRTKISGGSRRKQREEQDSTDGQRLSCVCYADLRFFLIQELHHLWCETAAYLERAITDPVLQKMLMHWRVVGIPKKGPLQNRPISVASVLFRTWLTACEPALPCPSGAQYACRSGTSVVQACATWLRACEEGGCGMERDLSKCFDMVPQAVGEAALAFTQTPGKVRAVARAAWSAPRTCQVAGEIANKPIWPTRSIAQGDSSSPKSLCAVLSPWSTEGSKFLFMDDRSIVAAEATLARDLVNGRLRLGDGSPGERLETSSLETSRRRTHLAVPDRPDVEIKPAAGWAKCLKCLKKIRACPGGLLTRTVLTKSYAKPLWSWCAPVFSLPQSRWCKRPLRRSSSRIRDGGARAVSGVRTLSCTPDFQVFCIAVQRITEWDIQWSSFLEQFQ